MLRKIKDHLYFVVAHYFKFWAQIQLRIWRPHIVVVTGSNGKTTTLHLLEAQLQSTARYSHHANSTYGIPFDILGLHRKTFSPLEWLGLFVLAPIKAWKKPPSEKVYVVEADAERPGEGRFLSSLLKPEIVIWLSCARTHSRQFEKVVHAGRFATVDEAIAYEFGYFVQRATNLILANADEPLVHTQRHRGTAPWQDIHEQDSLEHYAVTITGTIFRINGKDYHLPYLLPRETFCAIVASRIVAQHFDQKFDEDFSRFAMPPGRSSLFSGIRNTTIIDSSYNANLSSMSVMVAMVDQLDVSKKWAVLGDLIEQGDQEQAEHEKLADLLEESHFEKIVLVGPRLANYTFPKLAVSEKYGERVISFVQTKNALEYLLCELKGNEVLLFKGARFLEGIIEKLLADPQDLHKLCRREKIWHVRRKQWSL